MSKVTFEVFVKSPSIPNEMANEAVATQAISFRARKPAAQIDALVEAVKVRIESAIWREVAINTAHGKMFDIEVTIACLNSGRLDKLIYKISPFFYTAYRDPIDKSLPFAQRDLRGVIAHQFCDARCL